MPDYTVEFIKEVEKYPCLYNTSVPEYSNRVETKRAWEEIAKNFDLVEVECKEKWRKLRIAFARSVKHMNSAGRRSLKRYYLYEYMEFLIPYLKKHEGIVQIESPVTSEDNFEFEIDNSELANRDIETKAETFSDSEDSVSSKNHDPITTKAIYFNDSSFYDKKSVSKQVQGEQLGKRRRMETNLEDNSRKMFLMSLLPEIESFTNEEMRQFRRNVINCIDNIIEDRNK